MGGAHGEAGLAQPCGDLLFVDGIGVRVQQAHGHDLDLQVVQHPRQLVHIVFHHRLEHLTGGGEAFGESERQVWVHQRRTSRYEDVVQLGSGLPADRQHVLEPLRGHKRHPCPFALKHGIGRHGRAVHDIHGIPLGCQVPDAIKDGARRVVGGGPVFVDHKPGRGELDEVGKSSTSVDTEAGTHSGNFTHLGTHSWLMELHDRTLCLAAQKA